MTREARGGRRAASAALEGRTPRTASAFIGVHRWSLLLFALGLSNLHAAEPPRAIPLSELRSGITFAGANVQAMQADDFGNPGMLWVERGEKAWTTAPPEGQSCRDCHGDAASGLKGVAARYPQVDAKSGRVLTLEARINGCRTGRQRRPALEYESDELLGLTAYVATQSRGLPVKVAIEGRGWEAFERARSLYHRRIGQLNLSCAQCHDAGYGRRIYGEAVSQGHPTGYPGYRLEWQAFGSIERRLRACYSGVRAEMPEHGSTELAELQLYLAWRAQGLTLEAPGVRR
jgi:sulfur-oxidizing protein SoxA